MNVLYFLFVEGKSVDRTSLPEERMCPFYPSSAQTRQVNSVCVVKIPSFGHMFISVDLN